MLVRLEPFSTTAIESADVVIVGAGTVGLYLASRLSPALRVLLLEAGPADRVRFPDPANGVLVPNRAYTTGCSGRARGLGGTSNLWGGQMLPFEAFEITAAKGWPISHADLAPHYRAVSERLLDEPLDDQDRPARRSRRPLPDLMDPGLRCHVSKWLDQPAMQRKLAAAGVRELPLLPDTTLMGLAPVAGGWRLRLRGRAGQAMTATARRVVLTTHTIESVRLLLMAQQNEGLPLWDGAGRYFMDHPTALVGRLEPRNRYRFLAQFNTRFGGLVARRYAVKISATPAWCSRHGGLHAASAIKVEGPTAALQRSLNAAAAGATALGRRFVYKPFGSVLFFTAVEQEALASRRIELQGSRPVIHWNVSGREMDHIRRFSGYALAALHRCGWLRKELAMPADEVLRENTLDACHPMGGLRMGSDPGCSAVDRDLQLHNCPDLYVCTAAVYPSGSHSNPTMTLFALAERLAARLNAALAP